MSGLPASGLRGEAQTLLHSLAWNAERRAIRRVVRRGHDVDVTDDAGETPLHGAAAWGHCTTVRELLALGADPNIASTDGAAMTPLHWAASHGNLGVVRALVRAGGDVHRRDARGRTASMRAKEYGNAAIARWLDASENENSLSVTAADA